MKGPGLHYDLRVLRVFVCDGCGRQVQTPGNVTSHTCVCSDPPRFMRPLDRPRTVSPDVSAFISPPDPEDLVEEIIDETPHVPYVPPKPPPPARFANRRKLYEEAAPGSETDSADESDSSDESVFGEGIEQELLAKPVSDNDAGFKSEIAAPRAENADDRDTRSAPSNRNTDENSRRRRRGRSSQGGGERQASANRPVRGSDPQADRVRPVNAASLPPKASELEKSKSDTDGDSSSDNPPSGDGGENPRRRSRRRGRRRGPRPEGGGA